MGSADALSRQAWDEECADGEEDGRDDYSQETPDDGLQTEGGGGVVDWQPQLAHVSGDDLSGDNELAVHALAGTTKETICMQETACTEN